LDGHAAEDAMKRILVTGANGFIGQGLVQRLNLERRPHRVALRLADAAFGDQAVVGDIGPDTDWRRALEGIDAVIHLAGRAHVMAREADALAQFRRVNAAGTANLARHASAAGVRRFVLVSSVKAAADISGATPLRETEPPIPRTPYGVSKLEGEQALRSFAGAMETVILRPPLVHGPGVKANFRALLRLVDYGLPLPFGSIRNRRSLIARANLVDAILTAVESPGASGGLFYVVDGPTLSTPGLIRALAKALGRPARLIPCPPALLSLVARAMGRGEAAESLLGSLALDDSAFRTATGWTPPLSQQAAFQDIAAWYARSKARR
jgi:nucleoside-diphosphate-sugar epimerase